MFSRLKSKTALPQAPKLDFDINPFKAKKPWPPDFQTLSDKQKFSLERKWRRRTKLAYARPKWNQRLLLAQWGVCIFVAGYAVLYMDWEGTDNPNWPLKKIRDWYSGLADSIWTQSSNQISRERLQKSQDDSGSAST